MMLAIIRCHQINHVKQENGVIQIGSNKNSDKKHYESEIVSYTSHQKTLCYIGLEEYYIFKVIRKNVICGNRK